MIQTSESHLWEVIEKITGQGTVERVKKLRDFAFVHFTTREAALQAKGVLDGKTDSGYRMVRNASGIKNMSLRSMGVNNSCGSRRSTEEMKFKDLSTVSVVPTAVQQPSGVLLVPSALAMPKTASLTLAASSLPTAPLVTPVVPPFATPASNMHVLYGFCQLLEDYCEQSNWGAPQYQLVTTLSKSSSGQDLPLYAYKLVIPSLIQSYGSFQANKLFIDAQEAKEFVAYVALLQLGIPFSTCAACFAKQLKISLSANSFIVQDLANVSSSPFPVLTMPALNASSPSSDSGVSASSVNGALLDGHQAVLCQEMASMQHPTTKCIPQAVSSSGLLHCAPPPFQQVVLQPQTEADPTEKVIRANDWIPSPTASSLTTCSAVFLNYG
ncbi:unnamed protein product [Soboliphyme baturini]|uniref:RRM domain-containing protein n=1 Tax=Soboliphyme baturini TaxID=241478 RepID=A0A183IM07_9BILA|nr:unnamed protein product [Soboliphyme baturini]